MAGGFGKATAATVKAPSPIEGKSLHDLFVPATSLPKIKWLKLGVWGSPKVGKTHFTMTQPNGKIYIIDTEGSAKTNIQMFPKDVQERVFIFDILRNAVIKDGEIDYDYLVQMLEDVIKKTAQTIKEEGGENVTIVVDSATDIWDWLAIWVAEQPGVAKIAGGDKVNRLEWNKPNKKYAEIFRNLMMADCNIILTFIAKDAVGENGANLGYSEPRWQKNTLRWLDVVAQIDKVGGARVMKFTGSKNVGGRIVDKIPDLDNPDWAKMCAHIEKHTGVKFE